MAREQELTFLPALHRKAVRQLIEAARMVDPEWAAWLERQLREHPDIPLRLRAMTGLATPSYITDLRTSGHAPAFRPGAELIDRLQFAELAVKYGGADWGRAMALFDALTRLAVMRKVPVRYTACGRPRCSLRHAETTVTVVQAQRVGVDIRRHPLLPVTFVLNFKAERSVFDEAQISVLGAVRTALRSLR